MSQHTDRRGFLQTAAFAGVGFWMASHRRTKTNTSCSSPNGRIAMASIGLGGKGDSDSHDAGEAGDMVAICDVDENTLDKPLARRSSPRPRSYTDFRKMLDEMGGSIDAVTVSTPDHIHAPAALMAMRMGKHCFCQKPLTHSIYEARLMAQVGPREEASPRRWATRGRPRRLAQGGGGGQVRRAGHGQGGPRLDQSADLAARRQAARAGRAVPKHLHWNLWLGPAPERPYPTAIIRSTGAAGGTSAPAPWATWPATPSTCPTWP